MFLLFGWAFFSGFQPLGTQGVCHNTFINLGLLGVAAPFHGEVTEYLGNLGYSYDFFEQPFFKKKNMSPLYKGNT